MKKLFTIGFVLVILTVVCGSCHKSPNDFLNGNTWKFNSYQINGVEHSHDFNNLLSPHTLTDVTFQFEYYQDSYYFLASNIENKQIFGYYKWSTDSKTIWLIVDAEVGPQSFDSTVVKFDENVLQNTSTTDAYWTVVKLNNSAFHISRNGTDIYFKKQ